MSKNAQKKKKSPSAWEENKTNKQTNKQNKGKELKDFQAFIVHFSIHRKCIKESTSEIEIENIIHFFIPKMLWHTYEWRGAASRYGRVTSGKM